MGLLSSVALFSWRTVRPRKKLTTTLNLSARSISHYTTVATNSTLLLSIALCKMTINLASSLLMVTVLFMPPCKETIKRFCKKSVSSCPKSTEKEDSLQYVLLV